ncbi:MAG: hypothetical protein HUU20_04305 [Pirellulales bacterium]|nr:hypothetical protein [Pirellulales bacterium]
MGFNFFGWLREGVRQAVLLGVSDAVQNIGTPRDDDQVSHRLLEMLQQGGPATAPRLTSPTGSTNQGPKRKKLGRTLEEIQASNAKPA